MDVSLSESRPGESAQPAEMGPRSSLGLTSVVILEILSTQAQLCKSALMTLGWRCRRGCRSCRCGMCGLSGVERYEFVATAVASRAKPAVVRQPLSAWLPKPRCARQQKGPFGNGSSGSVAAGAAE